MTTNSTEQTPGSNRLKRNLTLADAIIMSAAFMGPAVSMYYNTPYATGFAGAAMPFTFLISLIASLILANTIGDFSRIAPSAGAFYTFSSKGFGPRTGFISGWLMFIGYSVLEPAEIALIGVTLSGVLQQYLHLSVHWFIIALVVWVLVLMLSWVGAKQSMKLSLILFVAEVVILIVLCVIVLAKGGFNGIHLQVFNPSLSPTGFSGIALGMVYGMLSFVGFEAATTLAEEVRQPKKNVYRALMGSTLLVGILYCFAAFAEMNGFGISHWQALAADTSPFVTLASRYGSSVLVLFIAMAGISSILAVTVNVHNAIVRVIYAMGREEIVPKALGYVHPRHNTPTNAIIVQSTISLIMLIAMGFTVGPSNTYAYLGALLTLGIIPVYMLAAIGYVRIRARQGEIGKHPFKYAVLPIIAALIMLVPLSGSFYPLPPAPYRYFPYIVLGLVVLGMIFILRVGRDPSRLERVGKILVDADTEPSS